MRGSLSHDDAPENQNDGSSSPSALLQSRLGLIFFGRLKAHLRGKTLDRNKDLMACVKQ